MALYWSIFGIIALFSLLEINSRSEKLSLHLFYAAIAVLFCLSFLRWERGSDWEAYLNLFLNGPSYWNQHTELGYVWFNKVIRSITDNYTIFLFVQSLVYYAFLISIFKKTNNYIQRHYAGSPFLYNTLLLFMFSQNFAGMFIARSPLAYIICLHALFDVVEKKKYHFVIKILIAFFIHRSSILFFAAYPLAHYVKFNVKFIIALVLLAIPMFSLTNLYVPFLQRVGLVDYSMYLGYTRISIVGITKWGILFLAMIGLRNHYKEQLYICIVLIFSIGFLLYVWSQFFAPVAQRISGLFMNSSHIWVSYLFIQKLKGKKAIYFIYVLYGAISLWSFLNGGYGDLFYPYKFFWDTFKVEVY